MPDVWPSVFDNLGESARDMLISSILPTRGRSRTWRGDEIALETSTEIPLLFRRYLQYSTVTLPKLLPYPPLFPFYPSPLASDRSNVLLFIFFPRDPSLDFVSISRPLPAPRLSPPHIIFESFTIAITAGKCVLSTRKCLSSRGEL